MTAHTSFRTAISEIHLDPDFFLGANLPWLRYGGDFGANAWSPCGGLAARGDGPAVLAMLKALRAAGVEVVRWFVLCDGRAGIAFDADGAPSGLDARVHADLDRALDWIGEAGLRMMPVLFDFTWCRRRRLVNGVSLGGRRRVLADPRMRTALVERVVAPLVERCGRDARIFAWDVINEPEWATSGVGSVNPLTTVGRAAMRGFIRQAAAAVHAHAAQPVTVGSARARWLDEVRGLGLDLYQPHFYERFERDVPLATPAAAFELDRPVVLGEFPTAAGPRTPDVLLDAARQAGYAGALFWSVLAGDAATFNSAPSRRG